MSPTECVVSIECDREAPKEEATIRNRVEAPHEKKIFQPKRRYISKDRNCRTNRTTRSVEKSSNFLEHLRDYQLSREDLAS